jgi:LacI family transcriptional regulator
MNGTKRVSDDTRERVERAILESQFTPHQVARSLRSGRTNSIGLVVSDTGQFIFGQMISEIERGTRKAGQTLLLANSGEDPEQEKRVIRALLDNHVDGIIIAPVADSDPEIFTYCTKANCPVVVIDRISQPGLDQVGIDNRSIMRGLTQHLIDIGHTNIALIAGDASVWTLRERAIGFREALERAGLPFDESSLVSTGRGLVDGEQEIEDLLDRTNRPTAVIAASGLLTLGALHALRKRALRVPDDIAFISFDGVTNSEFFNPTLTSFIHPVEAIGNEAMSLMHRRLADPGATPKTIRVRGDVFHGASCGCGGKVPLVVEYDDPT